MSRPDNWSIRSEQLASQALEGRDAVRTALAELRDAGYIITEKRRTDGGQFVTEHVVYDFPVDNSGVRSLPGTDFQASVSQSPVLQSPDNQATDSQAPLEELSRRTVKKKREEEKDLSSSRFDEFWAVYPRRVNKGQARKAWDKAVVKTEPSVIIACAERFATARDGQDPTFTPHPASWLNGERWLDEPEQKFVRSVTGREATIATVKEAMERLNERRQLGDGT